MASRARARQGAGARAAGQGGERSIGTCRHGVPAGREGRAWRVAVSHEVSASMTPASGAGAAARARRRRLRAQGADGLFRLPACRRRRRQRARRHPHRARGGPAAVDPAQICCKRQLVCDAVYLHHPIALDARGRKLSKQTSAKALSPHPLSQLREAWTFLTRPRRRRRLRRGRILELGACRMERPETASGFMLPAPGSNS